MSTINNQPSETERGQPKKFICSPEKTKFLQNFLYSVKKLNFFKISCHWTKKMKFYVRISSVNVTKSTRNCRFGQIY